MRTRKSIKSKTYFGNIGSRNHFPLRPGVVPTWIRVGFRRSSDQRDDAEDTFDTEPSDKYALILR